MPDPNNLIEVPQAVLSLPGSLDDIPVLHSNSPEIVLQSGILISTFPGSGKLCPEAHLDRPLSGRFDVFFHHIANAPGKVNGRTLYLALLCGNASQSQVTVRLLNAISYLTRPDAPFSSFDAVVNNDDGKTYAGPGDRVMLDLLMDAQQSGWVDHFILAPGQTEIIYCLPLPVSSVFHQSNGRTGLLRMLADGPVYLASIAAFASHRGFGLEQPPDLLQCQELLHGAPLVQPRDKTPTPPGASGELIYGRVAGIANGSSWRGLLVNDERGGRLNLKEGDIISFPIGTVIGGTCGTTQVQSAPLIARYPDTAYQSHGNYGLLYDLEIPLFNESSRSLSVNLTFQSPLKNFNDVSRLRFYRVPPERVVFRGSVKFEWQDKEGQLRHRLIHLVQKQGQMGASLVEFELAPQELQKVNFKLRYPADCTPPHALTITAASV